MVVRLPGGGLSGGGKEQGSSCSETGVGDNLTCFLDVAEDPLL